VRVLHFLQTVTRSANLSAWPEAFHTIGCIRIAAIEADHVVAHLDDRFHQAVRTLRFSSTPSGP
jgi:hypothetical protein